MKLTLYWQYIKQKNLYFQLDLWYDCAIIAWLLINDFTSHLKITIVF